MERSSGCLMEIHEEFEKTDFGKALASRVRYERYKPAEVTNERWVELLGADVNNLTHLTLTYGLTRNFIHLTDQLQPGYFPEDEEKILQIAALIHDWAESIVGDVSYGDKTALDEKEEQQAFESHVAEFYTGDATDLIDRARKEVVFDHAGESKLGSAFNAIERVGYLRTALRASSHVIARDAPDCEPGLCWIVADVLSQQPTPLQHHAESLEAVRQYLLAQHERISTAYELIDHDDSVFDNYPVEQRAAKRIQFEDSYAKWSEWLAQQEF
ncbi:MAG TPA: hypothetical protein VLG09_02275 [Candidatus Saccharimonadales bacterium]|nr:hypothetical protein [Candidatus Saccharimonadales bacterium]